MASSEGGRRFNQCAFEGFGNAFEGFCLNGFQVFFFFFLSKGFKGLFRYAVQIPS